MYRRIAFLTAAAALLGAAPAHANQLWVAEGGSGTTCLSASPCTLTEALSQADPVADQVIVTSGTYAISTPLALTGTIQGAPGAAAPTLEAAPGLVGTAVSAAGNTARLSHLRISAAATGQQALTLKEGARADRLTLTSSAGDGVKLESSPAGTVLTNSLVVADGDAAELKDRNATEVGTVALRNVTAYGLSGTGVVCKNTVATASVVNTLARGADDDLDFSGATKCSTTTTNARPAKLNGVTASGLVTGDPVLDADYRPQSTSEATIDRGTDDAANGTEDLDGNDRVSNARTDIGAFEHDGPAEKPKTEKPAKDKPAPNTPRATPAIPADPSTGTPAIPAVPANPLAPAAPPKLGKTVLLDDAGEGTVLVRLPGTKRYVPLSDAASIPVGTLIDTRKGSVTLETALSRGRTQTGTFGGGLFRIRQNARSRGMTDIILAGGRFAGCPRTTAKKAKKAKKATASAANAKKRKKARRKSRRSTVRRLWARDKGGRFRTHGRNSVATVRGTKWLTVDRCDGTYTKVTEGAVDVKDKRTRKVRRVKAGRSILVKRRR